MLQSLRNYPIFGLIVMGILIAVFALSGFFTRDPSQGIGLVGTVNGEPISGSEFNRAYQRRSEMMKMYGLKDEQIKQMKLGESVFQELVNRKLTIEAAGHYGLLPSDAELREYIMTKYPPFQKDGKFDVGQYKGVLQANNFTVASFEKMIREELQSTKWTDYFSPNVIVTETELNWEHQLQGNRRKVKTVLIPTETVKKLKSGTIEGIVRDMAAGKSGDAKIEAALKEYKIKPQTSDWITSKTEAYPAVGSEGAHALKDAFSGGLSKPKRYDLVRGTLVTVVTDSESPSAAFTETDRIRMIREITSKKERDYSMRVMNELRVKSKIKKNADVIGQYEGA